MPMPAFLADALGAHRLGQLVSGTRPRRWGSAGCAATEQIATTLNRYPARGP